VFAGSLNSSITGLLSGVCDEAFDLELGFSHYNDIVYGFEEHGTPLAWVAWDADAPVQTNEQALCGRQSLYVCSICAFI
jgi:hypothetical protein